MAETSLYWFERNLKCERHFLFFDEPFQQQWMELQRREFAPNITLKTLQQHITETMMLEWGEFAVPYEDILDAVSPLIEKHCLYEALKQSSSDTKNAPQLRKKM